MSDAIEIGNLVSTDAVPDGAKVIRRSHRDVGCIRFWEIVALPEKRYRVGDPVTPDDVPRLPIETVIMAEEFNAMQKSADDEWDEAGCFGFRTDAVLQNIVKPGDWQIIWLPRGYEQR